MRSPVVLSWVLLLAHAHAQGPQATSKPLRHDAAVEAIMVPSDDPRFSELNPAVWEPRIVVRNDGTDPLEGISVRYGTEGFLPYAFAWTGRIAPGAKAEVRLPRAIDMRAGTNTFTVTLGDPNGRKDKDPQDNTLSTSFTAAPVLSGPITVRWRVHAGAGGRLRLDNTRGSRLLDHAWGGGSDTTYSKELQLSVGSYFLTVVDSVRTADGTGSTSPEESHPMDVSSGGEAHSSVRILNGKGELIKALRGKERTGTVYQFRVDEMEPPAAPMSADADLVMLPGRGRAVVDVYSNAKALLVVTNGDGGSVMEWHVPERRAFTQRIDLSAQPAGSYGIKLIGQQLEELPVGRIDLFDGGPR